jgi:hypothetical protein
MPLMPTVVGPMMGTVAVLRAVTVVAARLVMCGRVPVVRTM